MAKKDLIKLKEEADKLFRKGKLDKAIEAYKDLEKQSKGDIRVSQKIAEILNKTGKKSEAVSKYKECMEQYLQKGFLIQAIALGKVVIEIDPQDEDAKKKLSELAERRQARGKSLTGLKKEPAPEPSAAPEPAAEEEAPAGTEPDYGMIEIPSEEESSAEPEAEPAEAPIPAEEEEGLPLEAGDSDMPEEGPVHTPLFSDLKPEELTRVFDMLRSVNIPSGVAICREGDQGDSIFVIAEGTVKVSRKGTDGTEIHLTNLGPGDFFGEFGYFANSIRQATVKAYSDVQLLEISRDDMDKVVEEFPRIKDVMLKFYRERVLDNLFALSPLFQGIGQAKRLKLIEKFELRQAEPGEVIVKEGEPGESMFLIKSGRVEVATINPINKNRTVLAQLENGDFFGEVSLIKSKPRTASVSAMTPVELMEIKRDRFEEIATEHPELKKVLEDTIERRVEATIEKVTKKPEVAV